MKFKLLGVMIISIIILLGTGSCCKHDESCTGGTGGTVGDTVLPFTEWDGFTYGVEFVAAHSGIAALSAGNTTSDPAAFQRLETR